MRDKGESCRHTDAVEYIGFRAVSRDYGIDAHMPGSSYPGRMSHHTFITLLLHLLA